PAPQAQPVRGARDTPLLAPRRHPEIGARRADLRADLAVDGIENGTGHAAILYGRARYTVRDMHIRMTRAALPFLMLLVAFAALSPTSSAQSTNQPSAAAPATFAEAFAAWDRGDFVAGLEGFRALVSSGDAATIEQIALISGELSTTTEITKDGRNPAFAGTSGLIVYETGRPA